LPLQKVARMWSDATGEAIDDDLIEAFNGWLRSDAWRTASEQQLQQAATLALQDHPERRTLSAKEWEDVLESLVEIDRHMMERPPLWLPSLRPASALEDKASNLLRARFRALLNEAW